MKTFVFFVLLEVGLEDDFEDGDVVAPKPILDGGSVFELVIKL